MKPSPISLQPETQPSSCGCSGTCHSPEAPSTNVPLQADDTEGGLLLRIPAMDCPTEESEIRRAVEHIGAIGGLRFDLSARTLRIDAPNEALPSIIDAIRKAGAQLLTGGEIGGGNGFCYRNTFDKFMRRCARRGCPARRCGRRRRPG